MGYKEPNPSPNRGKKVRVKPPASPAPPETKKQDLLEKIEDLERRLISLEYKVDDHIYIDAHGF